MQNGYTRIGNGANCVMVLHGWFGDSQIFSAIFPRAAIANHSVSNRLPATWTAATVEHSRETSNEEAYAAYAKAFIRTDFAAQVQGHPVAIHVMIGEHDPNLNLDFMTDTFMQSYPNASLEILQNTGHYPMQEIPLFFVSQVEKFLSATARMA